jgi:SAM-dependent methyltransferase
MQSAIDEVVVTGSIESPPFTRGAVEPWVRETQIGTWFINTGVWVKYVLARALGDLVRLAGDRIPSAPVVLDLACGRGKAIPLLVDTFAPRRVIAFDVDASEVARAERETAVRCPVRFGQCGATRLALDDASVDLVFCHQSFHHFIDQEATLSELYRVLKPGGVLLLSESLRAFIYTRRIRYLFRHPMEVQKSAPEYLHMFERGGFQFSRANYETSFVWWSRRDMGLFERLGFPRPLAEDTLLNLAAFRP